MPRPLRKLTVGEFRFDETTGELLRDGSITRLRPQAAQVLILLVRRAGEMVSREELQRAIWPEAKVEYDLSLNVCIRQIRVALGDEADSPRYIETLPRRGYRLLADVSATGSGRGDRPHHRMPPALSIPLAAVGLLMLITLAILAPRLSGKFRARSAAPEAATRMAVLPFRSIPANQELEYLEEGLSEELITALAGLDPDRLALIARTSAFSLADPGLDPVAIAGELDVRYLVEGAIRQVGDGYRVTVRLHDTRSGTYSWSESYDLGSEEVLHLERRVARRLSAALARELGTSLAATAPPEDLPDPRTRDAVLRARYLLNRVTREDAGKAVELLEEALGSDQGHAPVFVELARGRLQLGELEVAERALDRARRLAPELAGLEDVAGKIDLYGRLDPWAAAEHLSVEVGRHPGAAAPRRTLANSLIAAGRAGDAVEHGAKALELDPVSSTVRGDVGWVYYHAGRFADARRVCRSTLELFPDSSSALQCVLLAAALSNRLAEEIDLIEELLVLLRATEAEQTALVTAVRAGRDDELWRWLLADGERAAQLGGLNQARARALLDEHEAAARALFELAGAAPRNLLFVAADPVFADTRAEPLFRAAMDRAGLGRALGPS